MKRAAVGALTGLLAAASAVGVGEAVAAGLRPEAAPTVVVANRFILATPEWLKEFAIREFGTNDKNALRVGIYLFIAIFAAVVGIRAMHRLVEGLVGVLLFGVIGVFCALTDHAHRGSDVVPTIVATIVAALVLVVLVDAVNGTNHLRRSASTPVGKGRPWASGASSGPTLVSNRRQFIKGGVATAGLAAVAGWGGRKIQHQRFDASQSRAAVVLPKATTPAPNLPAGADLGRSPVPFDTPNADFYRVDTAYVIPTIKADDWTLKISGMVDKPIEITYAQLIARPLIERWITMACVSYDIGSNLISNALFRGTLLADLLKEAGIQSGANQLIMRSKDGMTIGAPVAQIMDGRDALLVVGMNGVVLPVEHGFPVRVVVPGLYGYVSACKWITEIEVSTFAKYDAYWVQRGWNPQGPIVLSSRIDTPASAKKVTVGQPVAIAGVAWHQHVGLGKVEVQVDKGDWVQARLGTAPSADTWRQWLTTWTPTSTGTHTITVRAFDADGAAQDTQRVEPGPGPATGLHTITVHASSA